MSSTAILNVVIYIEEKEKEREREKEKKKQEMKIKQTLLNSLFFNDIIGLYRILLFTHIRGSTAH
jgi:hypothetical protein